MGIISKIYGTSWVSQLGLFYDCLDSILLTFMERSQGNPPDSCPTTNGEFQAACDGVNWGHYLIFQGRDTPQHKHDFSLMGYPWKWLSTLLENLGNRGYFETTNQWSMIGFVQCRKKTIPRRSCGSASVIDWLHVVYIRRCFMFSLRPPKSPKIQWFLGVFLTKQFHFQTG